MRVSKVSWSSVVSQRALRALYAALRVLRLGQILKGHLLMIQWYLLIVTGQQINSKHALEQTTHICYAILYYNIIELL